MESVVGDAPGAARGHREVIWQARMRHTVVVRRDSILGGELGDIAVPDHLSIAAVLHHDDEDVRGCSDGRGLCGWAGYDGRWAWAGPGRGVRGGLGCARREQACGGDESKQSHPLRAYEAGLNRC